MEIRDPTRIQALIQALSDDYSRKITSSAVKTARSAEELSGLNDIPLGSCYRKVHELVEGGVLIVERIAMTDGKRCELFRSAYQSFVIEVENGSFKADVVINENIAEKLRAIWLSMKPLPTSH